jgi:hypothetical protein
MTARLETLLLTHDLALVDTTARAIPPERIEWRRSYGAALTALTPDTDVLVVDSLLGAPMAYLLANLFVDQRAGRKAVVIDAAGKGSSRPVDDRVTVLCEPVTAESLRLATTIETPALV